ncbi:unnamed protein product [Toxocara canis]|uniref:C2H2-type domain-containing protein n=1 Tax=Toxocara canis TaxID=6265 RepID=A0A183UGM3_TOXCA|nr:unnamed protein product [Toxocara canis]
MFYQSEDRFIEDDGNCETTTITRTTYEEKCFDDNCNINHPFSNASKLVDNRSLFESGIQKSGNEATGSNCRQHESESKCETKRLDHSRYSHCLTEVSEHGNCCHNIRIVPIRKTARSPGRQSIEHIHESRSRSAGPTSRRYFKECTECSRMRQKRQYCCGAHFTQHQHKRRLSWPSEECTFPEQPVSERDDNKITETNDHQALHRRYLLKQRYATLYTPNNDRNATKEVSEECTNASYDEHRRWETATNILSEGGFNKTSLSKHRCECRSCQFSKGIETGHELVSAGDSGGKRWRINEIKRSRHRSLGSDEYHMEKTVVDQRGQVCAVQNEFIDSSGGSHGCDTLELEAPKSAESGIPHAEQSGASNRESVIWSLRNQHSDNHSNEWHDEHPQHDTKCIKTSKNPMAVATSIGEERNQICFEERDVALQTYEETGHRMPSTQSFALDWHDKCKKSEKIMHECHRKTETQATDTQMKAKHAQSDIDREEAVDFCKYLDVDCCGSDNTDVTRNRDIEENCQFAFEQVSMLNFLQRSPEFDEDPCHVRYTPDKSENAEENKEVEWFNHRMDDCYNTCFDGKTNVLISNENPAQAEGTLKHTGHSGCESSDRDVTVAFVDTSQMPSRTDLLQQTDATSHNVRHSFSEFKRTALDMMTASAGLNSGDEQILDVQLSDRCRDNDAVAHATYGINSRIDQVEWYNNEAAQEHSETAKQISDEKNAKIIYKMNTSLHGKKTSTNIRPRGQSTGRCQNENCRKVTFKNDGNKDSEKMENCQETVKWHKHHQRNIVDECSEHSMQSSQSYEDNSDLRQSSSYVRDRSRRNATEAGSASDSSNSNAIDRNGMLDDEEVSHVSEVHEAQNTGNVVHRRLVAPSEHRNFTSGLWWLLNQLTA